MSEAAGAPAGTRARGIILALVLAGAFLIAFFVLAARRDEPERLVFASWGTVLDKQAYDRLVADYNRAHPELPVVFHHVSDPYYEKVMIQTVGGSAPDVFKMDAFRVVDWARRGALLALSRLAAAAPGFSEADFYPQLLENNRHEGRLYGVPSGFSTTVLYYNKDLFDRSGLEYPDESWDWERFLAAARKMTVRDAQGRTVQFGCAMDNGLLLYAWQAGGRFYDPAAERCVFNSPETVRGLEFVWRLLHEDRVSPSFIESSVLKPHTRFTTGHVPMILSGCWGVPRFSKSKDLRWGLARMPRGPAGPVSGLLNDSLVISPATRHREAAWRFVRFLTGREGQILQAREGNSIPAVRAVAESDAFLHDTTTFPNSTNRIFLESLSQTYPWPLPPSPRVNLGTATRIMTEELTLLSQGRRRPAEAAAAVERRVNAAIAEEAAGERSKPFLGSWVFWGLVAAAVAGVAWATRALIRRKAAAGSARTSAAAPEPARGPDWSPRAEAASGCLAAALSVAVAAVAMLLFAIFSASQDDLWTPGGNGVLDLLVVPEMFAVLVGTQLATYAGLVCVLPAGSSRRATALSSLARPVLLAPSGLVLAAGRLISLARYQWSEWHQWIWIGLAMAMLVTALLLWLHRRRR